MANKIYRNSTELMTLGGVPIYMGEMADACLMGRLNLFLQGDTGTGKTQLARDAMNYFGDKSMFILGRNDMDTRELFQQINLEKLRTGSSSSEIRELTDKVNYNLIVVDELPNCASAVRAQLFNLFDGFIELNGKAYPIGKGYSAGIATGNIGQKFTESSNELGRALKDRMHVIIDADYFFPQPRDTLEMLAESTNPRVEFGKDGEDGSQGIIGKYNDLVKKDIPFEKLIIANYLLHGLDYCSKGSKRQMKDAWPNNLESHEQGSDIGLVLPVSPRASKSIIRLSQALDSIAAEKGAKNLDYLDSMMQAYKFVSAYSGVLNEAAVAANYDGSRYKAMDSIITTTKKQFDDKRNSMAAGLEMVKSGKTDKKVLDLFDERWGFMKDILVHLSNQNQKQKGE
ncbi:MAG: AAA family ATPase [Candidatus Paceibacterota bacterium]